jgi:hypothetical protein
MRDLPVDLDREHDDLVSQEEEELSERGFFDDDDADRAAKNTEEQENTNLGETQVVTAEVDNSWRYLPDRARSALDSEIMLTIRIGGGEMSEYIWMSSVGMSRRYVLLADIALPLEPAPRSEAPTERAIGQARA